MNIFEQASSAVSRSIIEYFFAGGQWRGDEYWMTNPLRHDDTEANNFSINANSGLYKDLATGDSGNLIILLEKSRGITRLEAAKLILDSAGIAYSHEPANRSAPVAPKKPKESLQNLDELYYPIPPEKRELYDQQVRSAISWKASKGEQKEAIYRYYTAQRELLFSIVRFRATDKKGKAIKKFSPLFLKRTGKLLWSNPINSQRPLYHLPDIVERPDLPVLLVEGEKCADISVDGYIVSTWLGGANGITQTDWSILLERDVIFWADNDEAGIKTVQKIKEFLPEIKALRMPFDKPKGWDLADALAENPQFDIHGYIEEQLKPDPRTVIIHHDRPLDEESQQCNFVPLGYTANEWVFYLRSTQRLYYLKNTSITSQHLLQIENLSWWWANGFVSEKGTFRITEVIDYLKPFFEKPQGIFDYQENMGAGFYRIYQRYYWHTGSEIYDTLGNRHTLSNFLPEHIFIAENPASHPFYRYSEINPTPFAKNIIKQYFFARSWAFDRDNFSAKIALGWALWSPFCGLWKWRPHLHITASAGTGKSTFVDKCIAPLTAPYALRYNNLTTAPAIRQAVNKKARGVILEEFEANGKEGDKSNANIENIYDLAKSASDDASRKTLKGSPTVDSNGNQTPREFDIKATFLFISIREAVQSAALAQRIINIEMKKPPLIDEKYLDLESEAERLLKAESREIIAHNFRNIDYLKRESDGLVEALIKLKINSRTAQNFAPLLTFAHFFEFSTSTSIVDLAPLYAKLIRDFHAHASGETQMDDAEKCLDKILQSDILGENNDRKSAMKLINLKINTENRDDVAGIDTHLGRGGLAVLKNSEGILCLAVHTNSDAIRYMLRNSSYASSYASILRRHESTLESNFRTQQTKVSGLKPTFILLELSKIIEIEEDE